MAKNDKPKKRGRRQNDLPAIEGPGVGKPIVDEIDKAALAYIDVRDKRMALTKKEVELQVKLADAMHRHNLEVYEFDDLKVEIKKGGEKVKVKRVDPDADPVAEA